MSSGNYFGFQNKLQSALWPCSVSAEPFGDIVARGAHR